jgi:hypothetical protein
LYDKNLEKKLLLWNHIKIIWEYKVNNINNWLKDILLWYDTLEYIINSIWKNLNINDIEIKYTKYNQQYSIDTNYKWKKVNIILYNSYITKAYYDDTSIIDEKLKYQSIDNILNKITN